MMNKFLFLLIAFAILFTSKAQNHPIYCGDANLNGTIDIGDIVSIQDILLNQNNVTPKKVDYDSLDISNLPTTGTIKIILKSTGSTIQIPISDLESFEIFDPYNGHDYVNLGLPSGTFWATCNFEAEQPTDVGTYYSTNNIGNDIVQTQWKGGWSTPKKANIEELIEKCNWEWNPTDHGFIITGPNGNSIFLPASGYKDGENIIDAENAGFYWTNNIFTTDSKECTCLSLTHDEELIVVAEQTTKDRTLALPIRPIFKSKEISGSIDETPWEEDED